MHGAGAAADAIIRCSFRRSATACGARILVPRAAVRVLSSTVECTSASCARLGGKAGPFAARGKRGAAACQLQHPPAGAKAADEATAAHSATDRRKAIARVGRTRMEAGPREPWPRKNKAPVKSFLFFKKAPLHTRTFRRRKQQQTHNTRNRGQLTHKL